MRDLENKRTVTMWEEDGIAYRSNIVEPGGRIPLHAHANPHMASVHGEFLVNLISPEGNKDSRKAHNFERIEAMWQHEFVPLFTEGIGEVLCFCVASRGF